MEVACSRVGVKCIASNVDIQSGKTFGKHCHGAAKTDFFRKHFGDSPLATYYSDSLTDVPLFKLAERGYLVKGDKITLLYQNGEKTEK